MNSELADAIRNLELDLMQPATRKSPDVLDRLLADEFIEIGANGKRYTKTELLRLLPSSEVSTYTMRDFEAQELIMGIVLATYRVDQENQKTGKKSRSIRCSLWQLRDGRWQMVFHQGTPQET